MTVREATVEDIPALVDMGAKFHAMSPHHGMGEFDRDGIGNVLRFMIESPQALVLTNDTGLIGGTFAPVYFAPSKWMMEENFWWAGRDGFELLEAHLSEARQWGAHFYLLSTLENERSGAIDRMLTRKGFSRLERRYLMELS